jgi:hypothetical protein
VRTQVVVPGRVPILVVTTYMVLSANIILHKLYVNVKVVVPGPIQNVSNNYIDPIFFTNYLGIEVLLPCTFI